MLPRRLDNVLCTSRLPVELERVALAEELDLAAAEVEAVVCLVDRELVRLLQVSMRRIVLDRVDEGPQVRRGVVDGDDCTGGSELARGAGEFNASTSRDAPCRSSRSSEARKTARPVHKAYEVSEMETPRRPAIPQARKGERRNAPIRPKPEIPMRGASGRVE